MPVAPFVDLVLTWNSGISYGLFQQREILGALALLAFKAVVVVGLWAWLARASSRLTAVALGLIIGGAIGNAMDRLHWPGVMDFVLLHVETASFNFRWYVFNLADVAIVAGVAALLYEFLPGRVAAKAPRSRMKTGVVLGRAGTALSGERCQKDPRNGRVSGERPRTRAALHGLTAIAVALVVGLTAGDAGAQTAGSDSDGVWNKLMRTVGVHSAPDSEFGDQLYRTAAAGGAAEPRPAAAVGPAGTDCRMAERLAQDHQACQGQRRGGSRNGGGKSEPAVSEEALVQSGGLVFKEEYANFNGEPVRHDLSEPPAGYRVPSAGQPYGISADKKGAPLARPAGLAPVGESGK